MPLEVLRISTVVDGLRESKNKTFGSAKNFYCCRSVISSERNTPLEVLRISTVVDDQVGNQGIVAFGSAKNFYCCRSPITTLIRSVFGSAKNFYCCRFCRLVI